MKPFNWIIKKLSKKQESKELPLWAYGLECEICKKCFYSAKEHYGVVERNHTYTLHEGKIPLLRRK